MKSFTDPYFLREVPPVAASDDIRRLPNARDGAHEILWNVSTTGYHVLQLPSVSTIEAIVMKHTGAILAANWQQHVTDPALRGSAPEGILRSQRRKAVESLISQKLPQGDLRRELELLRPVRIEDAVDTFEHLFLKSKGNISSIAPSANGMTDSETWLAHFYDLFWERKLIKDRRAAGIIGRQKPGQLSGRWGLAVAVAADLRARNLVLAPQSVNFHVSRSLAAIGRCPDSAVRDYLVSRMPKMTTRVVQDFQGPKPFAPTNSSQLRVLRVRATDLGFCTNLESESDISWPFAEKFAKPPRAQLYTYSIALRSWLRAKAKASSGAVKTEMEKIDPFAREIEKYRGAVPNWCDAILSYRRTIVVKRARERARLFHPLLDWVSSLPELRRPVDVRRVHIRNDLNSEANTFRNRIGRMTTTSKTKNGLINNAAGFFDHVSESYPTFINPVRPREDKFPRSICDTSSVGKTYRKRIPSYVLEDLRNFIAPEADSGFRWGRWVLEHERLMVNGELIFCPLRPAIVALLASFPIRINQVCWLDSGELDENVIDLEADCFRHNPSGIPARRMGALQPAAENGSSDTLQFDFQISINKRPIGERADYTIPYVDSRTVWIIKQVLEWQNRYGLKPGLVREADAPYNFSIAQEAVAREKMPPICPLFRDPVHRGMFPPSYGRMKAFWIAACVAYDQRNANWTDADSGTVGIRKGWPQLSKSIENPQKIQQRRKSGFTTITASVCRFFYRYDLYSLKVGGVSHLLDRGIPLAVVSAMCGHRTLSMTLRYFVLDRGEMRAKLSELAKNNPELTLRPSAIEARLSDGTSHDSWLRGNSPTAMTALQHAVSEGKNFTISTTGICPGARCEDGLKLKRVQSDGSNRTSLVPGSLCGLCEFRVYGPPFLLGLVKEFNESLYTLTEIAQRQSVLRNRRCTLEAEGRFDEAIICRNEDEELSRRSEPDCAHTARLYEMITECMQLVGAGAPNKESAMLISAKPLLRPVIEQSSQFDQWKEILELGQILPNTQSRVVDQVGIRMQNRLMNVLARNGASPFLAALPEEIAKTASLEFARLLEKAVPSQDDRDDVFAGRKLFREVGFQVESVLMRANDDWTKVARSDRSRPSYLERNCDDSR